MAEDKKRKTTTSTAVKNRYLQKTYDQIIVRIPKEEAAAFKAKCIEKGISQSQIIKKAISDFMDE